MLQPAPNTNQLYFLSLSY